jgi:hypothetical protein
MWRKNYGDGRFCGGDGVVESGGETRNDGGDESEVHVIFYFIGD